MKIKKFVKRNIITISGGNASVFISNDRIRKAVQFIISLDIFDPAFVMFNAIAR